MANLIVPPLRSLLLPACMSLGLSGLANGGGGEPPIPKPTLYSKAVGFGDSIVQGTTPASSFYMRACIEGIDRLKSIRASGVAANTTTQMLARVDTDVIAYSPKVCVFMGGINDFASGIATDTTRSNIMAIVAALRSAAIEPIMCSLLPSSDFPTTIVDHNVWLKQYCEEENLWYVNLYDSVVDGNGAIASQYRQDARHLNVAGATVVAQALLNAIENTYSPWPFTTGDTATTSSMLANSFSLVDSNADGVPDSFSLFGSGVTSEIVTHPQRGKGIKLTMTSASAGGIEARTSAGALWAIGDKLLHMMDLDITVPSSMSVSMGSRFFGPNVNSLIMTPWTASESGTFHGEAVIPTSTTQIGWRVYATGTGTVTIYKPTVRNLTKSPYDYP